VGIEVIGTVKCPHCGNLATVHEQKGKANKLYYRCYAQPGSSEPRCGTVQITGPTGQQWLRANMAGATKEPEPAPQAPESTKEPETAPPTQKKSATMGGFLANFWRDEDE